VDRPWGTTNTTQKFLIQAVSKACLLLTAHNQASLLVSNGTLPSQQQCTNTPWRLNNKGKQGFSYGGSTSLPSSIGPE